MLILFMMSLGMLPTVEESSAKSGLSFASNRKKKRNKHPIYYSDLAAREAYEKELKQVPVLVQTPKPIRIKRESPDLERILEESGNNLITMVDAQNRIAQRLIVEEMERQADEEDAILVLASLL